MLSKLAHEETAGHPEAALPSPRKVLM